MIVFQCKTYFFFQRECDPYILNVSKKPFIKIEDLDGSGKPVLKEFSSARAFALRSDAPAYAVRHLNVKTALRILDLYLTLFDLRSLELTNVILLSAPAGSQAVARIQSDST